MQQEEQERRDGVRRDGVCAAIIPQMLAWDQLCAGCSLRCWGCRVTEACIVLSPGKLTVELAEPPSELCEEYLV